MSKRDGSEFNPTGRRLCPDGSCIGVVGDDDRCGECGRLASDVPTAAGPASEGPDEEDAPFVQHATYASAGAHDAGAFDVGRALCPDGSCLGVVGPDGRCGECGRPAQA